MDANDRAINKYNLKWQGTNWYTTKTLYARAARRPAYGVHLQDEVLVRLGASIDGHKSRSHYGKDAQEFIEWMTDSGRFEVVK